MAEASYSKGLEGVIADESAICRVDGQNGALYYRGHSIEDIARSRSFDETCYLLIYGNFPSAAELDTYRRLVSASYELPEFAKDVIRALPADKHPMEVILAVVGLLGAVRPSEIQTDRVVEGDEKRTVVSNLAAQQEDLIRLCAQIPTIIAYYHRHRQGKEWRAPNPEFDLLTNFLSMFHGKDPEPRDVEIFGICEILQMEHGFNASTFTARVVASTLSPIHATIAAAVGALYGKLHGGADEAAFRMARDDIGTPSKAESYVDELLARGGKVMGVGHRVYKAVDPRATVLKDLAIELAGTKGGEKQQVLETLVEVERAMAARMEAKGKKIYANVEFYKGPVFNALDIPTDHFTAMFAIARAFGWGAHVLELWRDHRLYRPRAMYVGP